MPFFFEKYGTPFYTLLYPPYFFGTPSIHKNIWHIFTKSMLSTHFQNESCNILKTLLIQVWLSLDILHAFFSLFSNHHCHRKRLDPFRIAWDRTIAMVIEFRRFLKMEGMYDDKNCTASYLHCHFYIFGSLRYSDAVKEKSTFHSMTFTKFEIWSIQMAQTLLSPLIILFRSP